MFWSRLLLAPALPLALALPASGPVPPPPVLRPVVVLTTGLPGNVIKTVTDLNGGTVLPGDTLVYDVTVTNAGGPDDALQVALIDSIPANTTFAAGSLVITSGPNAGAKTDATGDDQAFFEPAFNRVRFRLGTAATATLNGTISANTSTAVRFRVVVNAGVGQGTVISNSAQLRFRDGGTNAETAVASRPPGGPVGGTPTTVTVELPDLTIAKSHAGNFVRGASASYSLVVTNAGPGTTSGTYAVSDVLPAGLTPTLAQGTGWTCSIVAQTVTCSRSGALAAAASAPPITLTVSVSNAAASNITNTATVSGGGESNAGNNSASDPTTVVDPPIDLSIAKSHVGNFVGLRQGTFTLTVTNQTVASGTGPLTVTDTLATGVSYVSGTGTGWTCGASGQVVTCTNPGPIGPNASTAIALTVDVGAAAYPSFVNRAWVAIPGDAVPANDGATDPVIVESIPDFAITKTAGGAFVVGSQATYTLGITNTSSGPSFGPTTVTDTLPAGLTFVSGTGAGWTCGATGQVVTCTQPAGVPSGASIPITLTVDVLAAAAPSVTNRAHIQSPGDVNTSNNSATVTTPVSNPAGADLTITKTHTGNFTVGTNGVYTLRVTNSGTTAFTGTFTISDTLPAGLTFVSGPPPCPAVGQVITCTVTTPLNVGSSTSASITVAVGAAAFPAVTNRAHVSSPGDGNPNNNSAADPTTVVSNIDLSITKTAATAFTVGSPASYTLAVSNVGTAATQGTITVTDTVPVGLAFQSGTGAGWSCGASGSIVTCTNAGPLAPASSTSITLSVQVTAPAAPSVSNTAHVATPADAVSGNNSSTVVTPVGTATAPDLTLAKSATSAFVVGGTATYSLAVTNAGSAATSAALTVTDTLPAGLAFASGTGTGWSCAAAGQVVTCTNAGPLGIGATSSVTLTVTVAAPAVPSVTNTAHVATPGESNPNNNSGSVTTPVTAPSGVDLTITKTHTGNFTVGTNGVYTLRVTNSGTVAFSGTLTIVDTLPAGLTFVSGPPPCPAVGQVITCTVTTPLNVGSSTSASITVAVGPAAAPSVTNRAHVASSLDGNPNNNTASDPTTVLSIPDLAISKSATSAFTVGSSATYGLTITNVSTGSTTGALTVTDTLPAGLSFASGTGTGWSCAATGQVVTCTNAGPLAASASTAITLTVNVSAPAAPSVTNRAWISTPGDANTTNDLGTAVTPVAVPGAPNLALAKSHTGTFVTGQQGTYTLAITNAGSAATTGTIPVTDTLPTGLTFATGTGTSWSCGATGQVVTCTNPGPLATAASTSIALTVNVSAAALPSVTNRATVATPGDTDNTNDVGTDPTTVVSVPDLTIAKTTSSTFTVGGTATYQLAVTNVSAGPTTGNITITDVLPAGLTYQSFTGAGWSCSAVGQTVTCVSPGPLGASASSTVSIQVGVGSAAVPSVTNTATVSTPGDLNTTNNSSTISTPVATTLLDLSIGKSLVGTLVAGQNATYALTILNNSTQPTTGPVTVTDLLPAGLTFTAATGATCTAAGQVVTCTRSAVLGAGQSFVISLQVAVAPGLGGTVTNTATVATAGDSDPSNNTASVSAPVATGIDLAITKTSSALTVGSNGTFTLTVANVGSSPTIGAITITDNLPAGLTFVSGSGTGFTCTAVGQLVTCSRTSVLAAGQSVALALVVSVGSTAAPSVVNTATVTTLGDVVPGNNTATTGSLPVGAPTPDLALTKSLLSPPVAGGTVTFRLTVSNVGGAATSGITTVTDVLQAGLTFVSASGSGWTCSATGQTVTCTNPGPIAAGATSTIDLVAAVAADVTSISNTATVGAPGDGNPGNNTGGISPTPTTLPPDLALSKVANGPFLVGQPASYTITVRNVGSGPTTGPITVTDVVPAGLTITGASGSGWNCTVAGQVVTCTHPGPLAPNGTLTVTLTVVPTVAAVPSVTNRASVATPGDTNPGNNDDTVTTPVAGVIDLALTKQGADTLVVGAPTTYTLTARNVGTVPTTTPIVVTDSLPAGLTFVSANGPGFSCSAAGQLVTCTRTAPPLGAGESVTISVTANVTADAPATVRNVACVRTTGDGNTANDCGTKVSTPLGDVDLVALKDVIGQVEVGRPATFTLAVRNIGTAPARPPITMVDTLPAGLTFVSATGTGWQCGAAGNIVTCIRPTALPPGLSPAVTLTVNVTAAAFPRVTNCLVVRGTNETGSLLNNRSCSDPAVVGQGKLELEKRVARAEVQVGEVADYTIVVKNSGAGDVLDGIVTDILPAGFLLEAQSVRVNGASGIVVTGAPGPRLTFEVGRVPANGQVTLTYRVRVGPGARSGQQVNVAVAASKSRGGETPPARATVRVSGGVFDERGAIVGKVFIQCDCERRGMQDAGEVGIPGVRVYLEDGTSAVTDVEGKYNFYNVSSRLHVVKIDRTTLPAGADLVPLVNRNAGDGDTRFADVKAGELHRADFADGSRSPEVLKAVLARRRTGEVNNAGEPAQPVVGYAPRNAVTDRDLGGVMGDPARVRQGMIVATDSIVAIPRAGIEVAGAFQGPAQGGGQQSIEQTWTRRYAPLFRGPSLTEVNSQLPVTPLRARALQEGTSQANRGLVELRLGSSLVNQGVPADGQSMTEVAVRVLDSQGNPRPGRTVVTLEASLGRWSANDVGGTEQGLQAVLENGEGSFLLIAAPQPGVGEVRVTTPDASTTVQVTFVPVNRQMLVSGLVHARIDWQKLLNGGLGLSDRSDGFDDALRHWSTGDDTSATRAGVRTQLFMKGTVLDDRLLTLSYDSERDRGRTFFRDISPNEFFPVYGDASIREFDAQSRRRFYARLDKGTGYTMYGDFQTARADDRRVLTAYDRSLTGVVQHLEGRDGSATFFASQGRISQQVDEIPGRGISGPYALSRSTGLINSERVEIIVRDRNQPSVILSRTAMTRFADYTIEPVTGRILFRAPVQSLDANLNPVSIRATYETEDGRSKAFWVYGLDGSVRAGSRLELGATVARDEGPTTGHALYGVNATAKLGTNTTLFGELGWTRPEGAASGDAQRVELRHQSSTLEGRLFAVRSDAGYANLSSVFTGGRTEFGGRFSKQLAAGTRLVAEGLRSQYGTDGARREGALLAIERQFSQALRGEFGYRYARTNEPETATGVIVPGTPTDDRDVSALRARLQYTLPQNTRTSVFGEVEQDVRVADRRRLAVGGEYIIANRARLYGRHEMLAGFRDQFTPSLGKDRNYTVFGVDADYLKNTQVFSEYRARDAFNGRDVEASIGLRNRWAIAPGLLLNTSFERVSPLLQGVSTQTNQNEALAITGAIEWTKPSLWKSTARLEYRDAFTGDNTLASFGYARKLSRDWTLLGRTLWDDYDAAQRQTRGFSQVGLAWRETDRNHWNALARYEHRFERLGGLGQPLVTRDQAHILAAMVNYQPVQRFTFSGRYAGKLANNRVNGIESDNTAQLLMARGILDLSSRFDAGLITSTLFSDGFADRRYGLGGELGLILMKNLRVAGGYNLFGFTDKDLNTMGTTRKGPYLELGFKFDESLFGIGGAPPSGSSKEEE